MLELPDLYTAESALAKEDAGEDELDSQADDEIDFNAGRRAPKIHSWRARVTMHFKCKFAWEIACHFSLTESNEMKILQILSILSKLS